MINISDLLVDSLDYVMIVDEDYIIAYNTRCDECLYGKNAEPIFVDLVGRKFFDVYTDLTVETSSIAKCIETRSVIICKEQHYLDFTGKDYVTNNVTFPLVRQGKVIAAVELAMDVDMESEESKAESLKKFESFVKRFKHSSAGMGFDSIMTVNSSMKEIIEKAKMLSRMPLHTLIYGETGTGKEMFAQAMIDASGVMEKNVVIQNCAAVPENLMESILFGTVKGAYTGAETKKGLFAQADGGILFLDELNSMPYTVQAKLLRVLQDGSFRAIGATKDQRVNVKVIAAMNIDPMKAIEDKVLRKDLFFRFSGSLIMLPPLRERKDDIEMFLNYYIDYYNDYFGKNVKQIDTKFKQSLLEYSWEGNVRELKNTIESMLAIIPKNCEILTDEFLPVYLRKRMFRNDHYTPDVICSKKQESANIPYMDIMESTERRLILDALRKSDGNLSKAAVLLGIPRQTMRYRMKKLGING